MVVVFLDARADSVFVLTLQFYLKSCQIEVYVLFVDLPLRILYCKSIKGDTDNLLLHPDRKHANFSIAKPIQMLCAETRP